MAAEHTTMAYRAPELYDVRPGKHLDEKVDIWVSVTDDKHKQGGSNAHEIFRVWDVYYMQLPMDRIHSKQPYIKWVVQFPWQFSTTNTSFPMRMILTAMTFDGLSDPCW